MASILTYLSKSIGFDVVKDSSLDTKILIGTRFLRLSGYGISLLIYVLFLAGLGHAESAIGVFMTLTIIGDVALSLVLTIVADRIGRKKTLGFGALSMAFTGLVFATCSNYWVLLLASILGVITPTGNEIGPFKAIEESTLAQLVVMRDRPHILAWYYALGTVGTAGGTIVCGIAVAFLQDNSGWSAVASYRAAFGLYAALGLGMFCITLAMSPACELHEITEIKSERETSDPFVSSEFEGISSTSLVDSMKRKLREELKSLIPKFEGQSRVFIVRLALIFFVDQVANGIFSYPLVIYYFQTKFSLREDISGAIFFSMLLVAAGSNMPAGALTKKFGPVPTMLFTHFICSIASALIPAPKSLGGAVGFLTIRFATVDMNQVPRQAFIAAALLPSERTAAIGVFQVVRTVATSIGPVIAGWLTEKHAFWVAAELYGSIRFVYEFLIWFYFWGYKTREEQAEEYDMLPLDIVSDSESEEERTELSRDEVLHRKERKSGKMMEVV